MSCGSFERGKYVRQIMPKAILQFSLLAGTTLLASSLAAQEPGSVGDMFAPARRAAQELSVESIFGNNELMPRRLGTIEWMGDGSFTICEAGKGGNSIMRYRPATAESDVLISAAQLTPDGANAALEVAQFTWAPDRSKVLLSVRTDGTRFTYADPEHGPMDHWLFNMESGRLSLIGEDLGQIRLPKFSPDASQVAYIHKNDVWIEGVDRGQARRLTQGGSPTLFNGTGDWHYSHEWQLSDGFRWSGDSKRIAFLQVDTSSVEQHITTDSISGLYPTTRANAFSKAGTAIPEARIGVASISGGEPVWIDLPGQANAHYVPWFEWGGVGELVVQQLNRQQNQLRLYRADANSGDCRLLLEEQDPAWVEISDHFQWNEDRSAFTWLSERGGWRHLWSIPIDGEPREITKGDFDVQSIVRVDDNFAWFTASLEQATRRFLYRVPLSGGDPERLTPAKSGWHEYQISESGDWAIHHSSAFGQAPQTSVISMKDHSLHCEIENNFGIRETLQKFGVGDHGFLRIETEDQVAIDGWVIMPPAFDRKKMYPVVLCIDNAPSTQAVTDKWGGLEYLWHLVLAQRGYVVIGLDGRGSNAPRGRDWRRATHGEWGEITAIDQASAVQALCLQNPWMDAGRIGVWGLGDGGSTALTCMFRMPDIFKAGIAVSFTADQRYASSITQERRMGLPGNDGEAYRMTSPVNHALGLSGPLLLIHGTADQRNHYQNCQRLTDELIRLGKPFDMLAYPNRGHSLSEGLGTSAHFYNSMLRWWLANLSSESRKPDLLM